MEFSRKNKDMVLGLIQQSCGKIKVFGLNMEYLNFEFCLPVIKEKVLDFNCSFLNTYEFLILTNDSVSQFRRYDRSVQCLKHFVYNKDKRILMSRFVSNKDLIWLFYIDGSIEVFDNKFKKLFVLSGVVKPYFIQSTKNGIIVANQDFEFCHFETESNSKSLPKSYSKKQIEIKESGKEIFASTRLISFSWNEKSKEIVIRTISGLIGKLFRKPNQNIWKAVTISESLHLNEILDIDQCSSKPWIVTIGNDRRLTIWNYLHNRVEMNWGFSEDLLSVAIHPQGFYVCLGMSDKAIVYTVLGNSPMNYQRRVLKEVYLKNVYKVQFSKGGNYLAICSENPNAVNIYRFYTMNCPTFLALKGHTSRVQDLHFSQFNGYIYTCGHDGLLYKWNLKDGSRQEMFSRGPPFNAICLINDKKSKVTVMAASNEARGLIICKGEGKSTNSSEWIISSLLLAKESEKLIVGLKHQKEKICGNVRIYDSVRDLDKYQSFSAHNFRGVKKLIFTEDQSKVISLGYDNTICLISIKSGSNKFQFSDKIMVTKRYIEDLRSEVAYLNSSLNDNQGQNNNLITLSHLDDTIKGLKEQISEKQKIDLEEIKRKNEERDVNYKGHQKKIKTLSESNENNMNQLSSYHVKKISNENKMLGNCGYIFIIRLFINISF